VRLRVGRPDLNRYESAFAVPPAAHDAPLWVTFLGVTTLLLDDGNSALMTDGFFSRPSLARVVTQRVAPDETAIDRCLASAAVRRLDAVLPVHSHYDHALDSAVVAARTGAVLVGGESSANVGRGHGLAPSRILVPTPGEAIRLGAFAVTLIESAHCPPDRFPGTIDDPLRPPARASAYRCGEAWSVLVEHLPTRRTALIQGSAGFVPGALAGRRADVAYLGVGQLGLRPEAEIQRYWAETVRAVGALRVVLTHWDDFFRPLDQPLRATAFAGDDLDVTMRVLGALAAADGVELWLPSVWQREDPWVGIGAAAR
jgi:L-ascorbate metabolism protein UlaG (beta-lactamase superfamily)